jgi:GR25 family glycosyltransferase involved in LPS biosynthesis
MPDYNLIEKFVINLERRPDRLNKFLDKCPLKDVKVISAFDGQNPEKESSDEKLLFSKNSMKPGEIGCFISHLRIYKKIVEKNYQYAFIMEDDAIFCPDFHTKFLKVISEMPDDTDILYIGGRFNPNFSMKLCVKVSDTIVKHDMSSPRIRTSGSDVDRTTHAYIISNRMAKFFLDEFQTTNIIPSPIDSWILWKCLNNSITIYNSQPLLCHSPIVGDSDIR